MSDYWKNCVFEILDRVGVSLTEDQTKEIECYIDGCESVEFEATGRDCIPNPQIEENKRLSKALEVERSKVTCRECNGTGTITEPVGTSHWSTSQCDKCKGEGRHL